MILHLPDIPAATRWTEGELRLELACALHAQGKVTKVSGAELAGVDFFSFQEALRDRQISTYSVDDLHDELKTLDRLFASGPGEPEKR